MAQSVQIPLALRGDVMTVVAAIAAIGLLVYLLVALLKPERF